MVAAPVVNSEVHELQYREMDHNNEDDDDEENSLVPPKSPPKSLLRNLGISFFLFGLINNGIYLLPFLSYY
jgi:hypothetical protein